VEVIVQSPTNDDRTLDQTGETVIPLLAEEVTVSKQVVETGRVQVARVTHEREQLIDELLAHETVEIDRLPIGRQVNAMPAIREEGDTIVIPIVEEALVIAQGRIRRRQGQGRYHDQRQCRTGALAGRSPNRAGKPQDFGCSGRI
jgi:uncharacterized protein (TIGR02271 family)